MNRKLFLSARPSLVIRLRLGVVGAALPPAIFLIGTALGPPPPPSGATSSPNAASRRAGVPLVQPGLFAMCSSSSWPSRRPSTFFIATALADTVVAGAGPVRYWPDLSRARTGGRLSALDATEPVRDDSKPIYGQVFRLEKAGGETASRFEGSTGQQIVVVPWDYRADCHPVRWSESAHWVRLGHRGVFTAFPRDSVHWAGDRPTFDVGGETWNQPYPPGEFRRLPLEECPVDGFAAGCALSAEELFALYAILPDAQDLEADPDDAVEPLLAWAAANRDVSARYPPREILLEVKKRADHHRTHPTSHP